MMKRFLLSLTMLLGFTVAAPQVSPVPAAAYATEINIDVGCDTSAAWMPGTNWTVSSSKCVGTGVVQLKMLMQMSSKIKEGHRYRVSWTQSSVTGGVVRAFVGIYMPTAPAGSWVTAASITPIADNFTTSLGFNSQVKTWHYTGPGDSTERGGAFRFGCSIAGYANKDPIVYPGPQGSPHLHAFYGNTGVVRSGRSWGYSDFRTKGSSTCADATDPLHPINRTGYWIPAMLDGLGHVKRERSIVVYYKGPSDPTLDYTGNTSTEGDPATYCAERSPTTNCPNIPTGLQMTFGYKSSDGTCGPSDTVTACGQRFRDAETYSCWEGTSGEGGPAETTRYHTLKELMDSHECVLGQQLHLGLDFPYCWDTFNVDSPNHRDHIIYGTPNCPADHPAQLPVASVQAFYTVDQAFLDSKWREASDEMAPCFTTAGAGCTLHGDYREAWSPPVRADWFHNCIASHNSGSGEMCDTRKLKDGGTKFDGSPLTDVGLTDYPRPDDNIPLTDFGMSQDYGDNASHSVDITAANDGVWGFMGLGFTGQLDNIHVTEIPTGAKGPVTVHN